MITLLEAAEAYPWSEPGRALFDDFCRIEVTEEFGLVLLVAAGVLLARTCDRQADVSSLADEFAELTLAIHRRLEASGRPALHVVGGTDA